MFDQAHLFSDAQELSADGMSTNAVEIKKTPSEGVDIGVVVTASTTLATINVIVMEKAADSAWSQTDETQRIANKTITLDASGRARTTIRVQSSKAFLKLYYDGNAWGTATITAGIVAGSHRELN